MDEHEHNSELEALIEAARTDGLQKGMAAALAWAEMVLTHPAAVKHNLPDFERCILFRAAVAAALDADTKTLRGTLN